MSRRHSFRRSAIGKLHSPNTPGSRPSPLVANTSKTLPENRAPRFDSNSIKRPQQTHQAIFQETVIHAKAYRSFSEAVCAAAGGSACLAADAGFHARPGTIHAGLDLRLG